MKVVSGKTLFGTLRRWLIDNELEIWRRGQPVTSLPILVLIVLVLFAPWVSLPLLLLGLFSASGIRSPVRTWRTRPSTA